MIVLFALVGTLIATAANSTGSFPSVRELEASLFARPGAEIPKMVVTQRGAFHAYYVSAKAVGNGEYDVRVRLRP